MDALVARAPVRLDFGGGWTDVPPYSEERGGCVCNVAIQRYVTATVCRESSPGQGTDTMDGPDNALARAAIVRAGTPGLRVRVDAGFPLGAGLGGSSAAGVAVLGALAAWRGEPIDLARLAEESRRLEVEDLGIAGGRQDHYAAALGGALDLRFGRSVIARHIPLADDFVRALERRCVVVYTGQSRVSATTITAVMDAYRARDAHVLGALDRLHRLAGDMVQAVEGANLDALGQLVGEHWVSQRALHPSIPTPLIDAILEDAVRAGALGGKALGASGGGCVMAIAAEGREDTVRQAMTARAQPIAVRVAPRGFEVLPRAAAVSSGRAVTP